MLALCKPEMYSCLPPTLIKRFCRTMCTMPKGYGHEATIMLNLLSGYFDMPLLLSQISIPGPFPWALVQHLTSGAGASLLVTTQRWMTPHPILSRCAGMPGSFRKTYPLYAYTVYTLGSSPHSWQLLGRQSCVYQQMISPQCLPPADGVSR